MASWRIPALCGPVRLGATCWRSAEIALDGLLVPDRRLIRVEPGGAAGPALVQEIPALVEGDLESLQSLPILWTGLATGLFLEQRVFLVGQLVDASDQILIVHGLLPSAETL